MPVSSERQSHKQVMAKAKDFLTVCGCTVSDRIYLPKEHCRPSPFKCMEGMLVTGAPQDVTGRSDGLLGLKITTQSGRGSAAVKVCGYADQILRFWDVPGVYIIEGNAGGDLDAWVEVARAKVDHSQLLYLGDLHGFMRFWGERCTGHALLETPRIPRQDRRAA